MKSKRNEKRYIRYLNNRKNTFSFSLTDDAFILSRNFFVFLLENIIFRDRLFFVQREGER